MSDKPDAIVKEETGRLAIDRLVGGITEDARRTGRVPNVQAAEDFARPIVEKQIKLHEARHRNGVPDAAPKTAALAPTVETEVSPGVVAKSRHMGAFSWDPNTGGAIAPMGKLHPKLAKKIADAKRLDQSADAREQVQLRKRLDLLRGYPEWDKKLVDAYFLGCGLATKQLLEQGKYTITEVETLSNGCAEEVRSIGTDHAMKIVEDSCRVFGDWKTAP